MSAHRDRGVQVAEVRRTLVDPVRVCERLGLAKGARRQSAGLSISCPVHVDRTPSCSVTRGPDGTIRVRCFGCGWSTDVLGLVAAARGLEPRRSFREVLAAAADIGGLPQQATTPEHVARPALRVMPPAPEPRDFPAAAEVAELWSTALPVADVEPCKVALAHRGLFPGPELARALSRPPSARWARYQGVSWLESGHRILLPVFDPEGALRSVRAWQVDPGAQMPKRLPPVGHRATGLVLANPPALAHLRAPAGPVALLIAEGEPDFLSLAERYPGAAVIGVVSGSWSEAFAARIPFGSTVAIRTHHDSAGGRYAAAITETLAGRAVVKRGSP